MSQSNRCPECGAELPAGAPQGLCPRCLLGAGLEIRSKAAAQSVDPPQTPTTPYPSDFIPPPPEELAARLPQLEILELVGQGGMGAVYKARQPRLDQLVALKIIRPEAANDPTFAERFNREARTLARLSHPHIVGVYDFGESAITDAAGQAYYYFLMEYVDGASLRELMRTGELTPEQALAIVPQVCEALQFAHDEGVVHRDIKPENILLDKRGRVKIADFGLAKIVGRTPEDHTLTGAHQVMGTPRYMAPEQMEGAHAVDHRADIYSLGVVFYEMLTGEVPAGHFEPPSKKVEIDVRLDEIVLRSLAREPERRYQQASAVKSDVESVSASRRTSAIPPSAERSSADPQIRDAITSGAAPEQEDVEHASSRQLPPSTVHRAWIEERGNWATAGLAVAALACLLAFFYPQISIRWHPSRHANVDLGPPLSPWFRSETDQGWSSRPSRSWLLVPLALLAWSVRWQIVKTRARAQDRPPRWRDSTWALVAWTIGAYFVVSEAAIMLPHLPLNVAWDAALVALVAVVLLLPWAFIFLPQRSKDLSGPPAAGAPVSKQRGTLGRTWDQWWAERDWWVATSVQVVLGLVYLVCLFSFVSFYTRTELHSQPSGEQIRETIVQVGAPGAPWMYFVDNPAGKPGGNSGIILSSWSFAIMALGFLAQYVSCRIERAKVEVRGDQLRWHHSTRVGMSVGVGVWAVLTLGAALVAYQSFEVSRSHGVRRATVNMSTGPDAVGDPAGASRSPGASPPVAKKSP